MHTLLTRRLAPLLALFAITVSACGTVAANPAASVNGVKISVDSIDDELDTIRSNKAYREALEQSYSARLAGVSKGTFDSTFVAQLLSLRVYYELLEQSLAELGATVTRADLDDARETVRQQLSSLGPNVYRRFPVPYRQRLARQDALITKANEEATTGSIARAYFEEHGDEFEQACVSHILITTENRSEGEAEMLIGDLKAQLEAGADFAALASASSEDPGSKDAGGDLDCGTAGRFVPEFEEVVFSAPIGEVSDPVKTDFGVHLILVRSRETPDLEDVGPQVAQSALTDFLIDLTCGTGVDVDVNPRYGMWDRSPCEGDLGLARVNPPTQPATEGDDEPELPTP